MPNVIVYLSDYLLVRLGSHLRRERWLVGCWFFAVSDLQPFVHVDTLLSISSGAGIALATTMLVVVCGCGGSVSTEALLANVPDTPVAGTDWSFLGIEFVWIPPGGLEDTEASGQGSDVAEPHPPMLTSGFWLSRYEITQDQWNTVMGYNRSQFKGGSRPVDSVPWDVCQLFIERLDIAVGSKWDGYFRLPTEAEWEYACCAGRSTCSPEERNADYASLEEYAWCQQNSVMETHAVGLKKPNALGLYDMLGNVSEWCEDWNRGDDWHTEGVFRVLRGGCYADRAEDFDCFLREYEHPGEGYPRHGFRLAYSDE